MDTPTVMNNMDSYGYMLIGAFFCAMAWGVSCMQAFLYFLTYTADFWAIKLLVVILCVVDAIHVALLITSLFPVLILHWGDGEYVTKPQAGLVIDNCLAAAVAIGVQMFFLYRIYIFNGRKWLFPVALSVISWWQLIASIMFHADILKSGTTDSIYSPKVVHLGLSMRATSAGLDMIIAGFMAYLLVKQGQSIHPTTNRLVYRLIIMIIMSGMLTAVVALADLLLLISHPNSLQYCMLEFPLCSLYVNALLANLNARYYIKNGEGDMYSISTCETKSTGGPGPFVLSPKSRNGANTSLNSSTPNMALTVHIDTSRVVYTDAGELEEHPEEPESAKIAVHPHSQ